MLCPYCQRECYGPICQVHGYVGVPQPLDANEIKTGQIDAARINGQTITGNVLNGATINASTINSTTIHASTITADSAYLGSINGTQLVGGTVPATALTTDVQTTLTSANGKNHVTYSAYTPSIVGTEQIGDTWFQTSGATIIGQWKWTGSWSAVTLSHQVISSIDAGAITAGTINVALTLNAAVINGGTITGATITGTKLSTNTPGLYPNLLIGSGSDGRGAINFMDANGVMALDIYSENNATGDAFIACHGQLVINGTVISMPPATVNGALWVTGAVTIGSVGVPANVSLTGNLSFSGAINCTHDYTGYGDGSGVLIQDSVANTQRWRIVFDSTSKKLRVMNPSGQFYSLAYPMGGTN